MVSRPLPHIVNLPYLLVILLLALLAPGAAAQVVLHDGPSPAGRFFTAPDHVHSTTEYTEVSLAPSFGQEGTDHYLLPIPPGEFSAGFTRLEVRSRRTGEMADLLDPGSSFTAAERERFLELLTAEEAGTLRRLRVAAVRVNRQTPVRLEGEPWEIARYTFRLDHEPAPANAGPLDSGFAEGPYRRFLEAILTVPAGIDTFAAGALPGEEAATPGWRPEPELSPGLPWSRIPIREDGLYAIGSTWLREAGLDAGNLRPDDLCMIRQGVRIPLHPIGPEGATFAEGARALFHGTGNPGRETAYRSHYLGRRPPGTEPLPFPEAGAPGHGAPAQIRVYTRRTMLREENILKTRMGEFLSVQELTWVWADLTGGEPLELSFDLDGLGPQADRDVELRFRLYSESGEFPDNARLLAWAEALPEQSAELHQESGVASASWRSVAFRPEGNRLTIRLEDGGTGEGLFLQDVEVRYPSRIAPSDGQHVYTPAAPGGGGASVAEVNLTGWRFGEMLAVNVRDPDSPVLLAPAGPGSIARRFVLPEPERGGIRFAELDALPAAPSPENRPWADWRRQDLSADIVIITHRKFQEAARLLAADHEAAGYEPLVVDVEELYENFSHGDLATSAIRDFLRQAVHAWEGRRPFAAILIGESNADGRGIAGQGIPNYLPIPVISSSREGLGRQFSSDSVYSWLTPGDELSDIIIARLSPATEEDALNTVANITDYRASQDEEVPWGNRLVSIVDTGDFTQPMQEVDANSVRRPVRNDFLYADKVPWEDNYYLPPELIQRREDSKVAPLLTAAIEDAFHEGAAVMTFFGHGAPNLWSNHRFWFGGGTPNSDILRLRNEGRLPFVTSFTCNNAVVDYPLRPWNISIAEDFMRHRGKGAIACFMPSGPGYTSSHMIMAEGFLRAWSELGVRQQGLLGEFSRINHQIRRGSDDHTRMFLFLGDPTLRLPPLESSGDAEPSWPLEERLHAEGRDILIEAAHEEGPGTGMTRTWTTRLVNNSRLAREAVFRLEVMRASGEMVETREQAVSITPGGRALIREEVTLPEPGVYTFRSELPHRSGAGYAERMPSRLTEGTLTAGEEGGAPRILAHGVRVRRAAGGQTHLEADVFNPLPASVRASLTAERVSDGERVFLAESRVSSGRVQPLGRPLPAELLDDPREGIRFLLESRTDDQPDIVHTDEIRTPAMAELFPRLVIDPGSLSVSPTPLSDGLTVFVEGLLRNDSSVRTGPVVLGLYAQDDERLNTPLPDMTRIHPHREEPLNPGEERRFRLRWDPEENAGEYAIRIVADPEQRLPLRDRELSEARVPLTVRTKARLATGELLIGQGEKENSLRLAAQVANTGETDARLVVVEFHYAQDQRPETRLGEVLLERVRAGSTETVEFLWEPTPEELGAILEPVQPSFNIALRGSLQRVSSVAD